MRLKGFRNVCSLSWISRRDITIAILYDMPIAKYEWVV